MKRAFLMEDAMLKRSIKNQMRVVTDQSDKEKQLLLSKFYPAVYQKNAAEMMDIGTKIDRKPPAESKHLLRATSAVNTGFKNKFMEILDTTRSFAQIVDGRKSISKD